MLQPNGKIKYRRVQRGRMKGKALRGNKITNGEYGLVALGSHSGSFVVNAYPVSVHPEDIVLIFVTVLVVGFLAVWYPVRYFAKRLLA